MYQNPCIIDFGALHLVYYFLRIPTNIAVRCTIIYFIYGGDMKPPDFVTWVSQ